MTQKSCLTRRALLTGAAASVVAAHACSRIAPPDLPNHVVTAIRSRAVFYVTADTHFGHDGMEEANRRQVAAMNGLVGTPFPKEVGGSVEQPVGTIVAGDLTESGTQSQWKLFLAHYGDGGLLHSPVYECSGNHDRYTPITLPVLSGIEQRHGSLLYGMAWGGLVVLCLDLYPRPEHVLWLKRQLEKVGRRRPVAIYFHYAIEGPYSDWWDEEEKDAFAQAITGYNVVALFHGHAHESRHYSWRKWDVYNVGSPKHGWHSFAAVRVTETSFGVASWDWEGQTWQWQHRKALTAG